MSLFPVPGPAGATLRVLMIKQFKKWRPQWQWHDNATNQLKDMIGWMGKNNRAARAARSLVQFFDMVCQTTTWNFPIRGSDDNMKSFKWKPFVPSKRTDTSPTLNSRLNRPQSYHLKWIFRCSGRRGLLNSPITEEKTCSLWEDTQSARFQTFINKYYNQTLRITTLVFNTMEPRQRHSRRSGKDKVRYLYSTFNFIPKTRCALQRLVGLLYGASGSR